MPENRLLLIDGTAQIYRAFYAIRGLTDPKGFPVNAVYGFAQILFRLLAELAPTHAAVVFDRPEPTQRHEIFPQYKAQRQATPEDLKAQIPMVKELVASLGVALCEQPGIEADDLLGTLAVRAAGDGAQVMIFSSDKDLFQLVSPQIRVVRPLRGGEYEVLDAGGIERVFGAAPPQVADVLALMGDSSDNIPGVPGIGEKTALELIRAFGSLAGVYRDLDKVQKPKVKLLLAAHAREAEFSKELVRIRTDIAGAPDWETCPAPREFPASARRFLSEHGFQRLLSEMPASEGQGGTAAAAGESFGELTRIEDPLTVLAQARKSRRLAVELLEDGIALAAGERSAAFLPVNGSGRREFFRRLLAQPEWKALFAQPAVVKIGYDLKPFEKYLQASGLGLAPEFHDLHLAAHLLDLPSNRREDFYARFLGTPLPPAGEKPWASACAAWRAASLLEGRLRAQGAEKVYYEVELPLLPVLAEMEREGVAVDEQALNTLAGKLGEELGRLEAGIQESAGTRFNVRSPQQLAEVLFDRLGLGGTRKVKRSTNVEVLETLAALHPLPGKVLEFRQLQKIKSTYLDVLPALLDPEDHRLHTTFQQVGAATGRLSSADPNLQNIPIRTELGRSLRRMFVAGRDGCGLFSADYSQIELRLLAHLSRDEQMLQDFHHGRDIHRATAAQIFGVPESGVTPEMRRQAKTCNFGIAYGVSPFGLARQLGLSVQKAKEFIDGFYFRYPQARFYFSQLVQTARQTGYVSTLLGRRRYLPELASANRNIREAAERMAVNTPLQGSAADLMKLAMIRIARRLKEKKMASRMILQVHDELLFEGPEEERGALESLVVGEMSRVYPLQLELGVEAGWGKNWMEAHA